MWVRFRNKPTPARQRVARALDTRGLKKVLGRAESSPINKSKRLLITVEI